MESCLCICLSVALLRIKEFSFRKKFFFICEMNFILAGLLLSHVEHSINSISFCGLYVLIECFISNRNAKVMKLWKIIFVYISNKINWIS